MKVSELINKVLLGEKSISMQEIDFNYDEFRELQEKLHVCGFKIKSFSCDTVHRKYNIVVERD